MSEKATSLMPDRLSEAMVATAAGYFTGDTSAATEDPADFRRTMHNMYEYWPDEARAVLAAGLRAAGFIIETEPLMIETPSKLPEKALDGRLFMDNWYNVSATIIDMGLQAISADSPGYDEEIAARVTGDLVHVVA